MEKSVIVHAACLDDIFADFESFGHKWNEAKRVQGVLETVRSRAKNITFVDDDFTKDKVGVGDVFELRSRKLELVNLAVNPGDHVVLFGFFRQDCVMDIRDSLNKIEGVRVEISLAGTYRGGAPENFMESTEVWLERLIRRY